MENSICQKDLSQTHKLTKFKKMLPKTYDFRFKRMKKIECPKIRPKVVYELLIRSYKEFNFFPELKISLLAKTPL